MSNFDVKNYKTMCFFDEISLALNHFENFLRFTVLVLDIKSFTW